MNKVPEAELEIWPSTVHSGSHIHTDWIEIQLLTQQNRLTEVKTIQDGQHIVTQLKRLHMTKAAQQQKSRDKSQLSKLLPHLCKEALVEGTV